MPDRKTALDARAITTLLMCCFLWGLNLGACRARPKTRQPPRIIVTFASCLAWFWLIRNYPATRLASFTLLTPVFGMLLGAWLLSEPITIRLWLALAAVTAGIVLVNRGSSIAAS